MLTKGIHTITSRLSYFSSSKINTVHARTRLSSGTCSCSSILFHPFPFSLWLGRCPKVLFWCLRLQRSIRKLPIRNATWWFDGPASRTAKNTTASCFWMGPQTHLDKAAMSKAVSEAFYHGYCAGSHKDRTTPASATSTLQTQSYITALCLVSLNTFCCADAFLPLVQKGQRTVQKQKALKPFRRESYLQLYICKFGSDGTRIKSDT